MVKTSDYTAGSGGANKENQSDKMESTTLYNPPGGGREANRHDDSRKVPKVGAGKKEQKKGQGR